MNSALELKVIFAAVDKFVRPVNNITSSASAAAKALRENTTRLKELDKTVANIDAFKKAEKEAAITANTYHKNQQALDELKAAVTRVGVPTKAMAAELERLGKRSEDLRNKHQSLTETEQRLFEKLKASKVDTSNLATARQQLASASAEAQNQSRRLTTALEAENQKMRQLRAAQANLAKSRETAGKVAMAGAGITAAGAAVALPVGKAVSDFAAFETAMLGVARQMEGARDTNGKVTKTYWEMAESIKAMSERLPGTAADIAKIVEGGARMGIQGKDNLLIYAETTAIMAKAFDLPVDQVGEDIGKISQLYKVPIKDIKQLGDTINWLDDQALAKGGDIIDVMKRIAGTADMANMSFRDAAALGSTFLSLGANAEVAASASNAMIRELAVADMQSKRFKEGLSMLGLEGKSIQIGMSKDATGTIIKVLEKIKSLSADKQLEAATRIFGKEFGDDAAKLASNLDEYRRQLQLTKDQAAFGSMQREADAWGDTLDARISNARDAFSNLSSDLGKHLKPAIASSLETTLGMVQAVRNWAAEHPALAGGLMTAAKGLALVLAVVGTLTIAAGAILVPLAMLKFSMSTLGIGAGASRLSKIGTAMDGVGNFAKRSGKGIQLFSSGLIDAWRGAGPTIPLLHRIEDAWAAIPGLAGRAMESTKRLGSEMKNGIASGFEHARKSAVAYSGSLIDSIKAGKAAASTKMMSAVSYVKTNGIKGTALNALGGIKDVASSGIRAAWASISSVIMGAGRALLFVGRAALMNPIGLAITALAVGGALIFKYWEPIKAFFSGFWQGLKEGLAPLSGMFDKAFGALKPIIDPLKPVWDWVIEAVKSTFNWVGKLFEPFKSTSEELDKATQKGKGFGLWLGELVVSIAEITGKFFGFGANIVGGLINGILSGWDTLKSLIGRLAGMLPEVVANKLGIRSPSRVFAELGMHTMAGLEQGIDKNGDGPLSAIKRVSAAVAAGGALTLGAPAIADTAGQGGAANPLAQSGNTYQIYISTQPGTDNADLSGMVEKAIERIEAKRAARGRSRLRDQE